ncbi:ABC transporter ATP-binding protein [Oerskovia turbata]|uniref:ABC transporter ATP-binding protein n=1 Tax=Oerskovia turbata TaxID=1713 RepID=A0A4Q1L1D1_9CELL|nr:ABC transporter ATP-binding protein [Oerskovia turbata]RXR26319.1 ABC transporter ATP-binding protein [Oerskovia turbata]RXR36494.1 ABC transporter ATP-binding protein [Oerskovia turbata]TGJ97505.1 ABC transporter ATP-binding protein [Actinotalea fermentans ATCC 43279 = JCM 9966 = DSM 3133]
MAIETAPQAAPAPTGEPVLTVRDLGVDFYVDGEWFPAASGVSYDVHPGEVLAIVGESGSGKTQSSMSLIGLLPPNGRATGSAKLGDRELIGMSTSKLRHIRGKEISVIFQEPMTALNPVYTVGFQIVETLRTHFDMGPKDARKRAIELLTLVEIPEPERRFDSYPHQLSGGQRQRAMIAQALACDPRLLIADEPTTALDVTVQAEILKLMRDLRHRIDSGIILITHDMGVVADMADRILVMKNGLVVEEGTAAQIFSAPQHPYTQRLLDAVPHLGTARAEVTEPVQPVVDQRPVVLEAKDMVIEYPGRGRAPGFRAVDRVNLTIRQGEVVGLVGESGSGKTTIGRAAVGLLPVTGGELSIVGQNMVGARSRDLRPLRNQVGIVFQDPGSSLNPRLPIGESIGEPLMLHKGIKGKALSNEVERLLDQVELPRAMRNRYPHELSGGQRQRVGIARALSLEPKLLVADEPTSALDVSVQAKVLDLFQDLQREHGFACLFISHDLAVVEILSDRIAVMHHGKLVEVGDTAQVVNSPRDDYTRRLLAAVPVPDPEQQRVRREARDLLLVNEAKDIARDESSEVDALHRSQLDRRENIEGDRIPQQP